jgi:hypothetical protein
MVKRMGLPTTVEVHRYVHGLGGIADVVAPDADVAQRQRLAQLAVGLEPRRSLRRADNTLTRHLLHYHRAQRRSPR